MKHVFLGLILAFSLADSFAQAQARDVKRWHYVLIHEMPKGRKPVDEVTSDTFKKALSAVFPVASARQHYTYPYTPDLFLGLDVFDGGSKKQVVQVVRSVKGFENADVYTLREVADLFLGAVAAPAPKDVVAALQALNSKTVFDAFLARGLPAILAEMTKTRHAWIKTLSDKQLLDLNHVIARSLEPLSDVLSRAEGVNMGYSRDKGVVETRLTMAEKFELKRALGAGLGLSAVLSAEAMSRIQVSKEPFGDPEITVVLTAQMLSAYGKLPIKSLTGQARVATAQFVREYMRLMTANLNTTARHVAGQNSILRTQKTNYSNGSYDPVMGVMVWVATGGQLYANMGPPRFNYSLADLWIAPNMKPVRELMTQSVLSYFAAAESRVAGIHKALIDKEVKEQTGYAQAAAKDVAPPGREAEYIKVFVEGATKGGRETPVVHLPGYDLLEALAYRTGASPESEEALNGVAIFNELMTVAMENAKRGQRELLFTLEMVFSLPELYLVNRDGTPKFPQLSNRMKMILDIEKSREESCDSQLK